MSVDAVLRLAPLLIILPWAALAAVEETARVRSQRPSVLIPLLILGLPFYRLIVPSARAETLYQAVAVTAVVYYFSVLPRDEAVAAWRRVRPILVPCGAFLAMMGVAYAASPSLTRADVYDIFNLVTALAFILLAGVYCRSLGDLERLLGLLVGVAVLQLPIIAAQGLGLASGLPGGLAALDPSNYGGVLTGVSGTASIFVRYPGSFGDYELLAEYSGLMLIVCIGVLAFGLRPSGRLLVVFAAFSLLVTGWFTGTRAFVLGTAGGLVVLTALALVQRGHRLSRLGRLLAGLGVAAGAALLVIPDNLRRGFIERLAASQLSGPNALNRGQLFANWLDLAERMPLLGYGPRIHALLSTTGADFRGTWPHSLYFTGLLTAGWLGLVALLWTLVSFLYLAASTALRRVPDRYRHWGAVLTAAAAYLVANEVKIEMVRHSFYLDLILVLFGIVSCLYVMARTASRTEPGVTSRGDDGEGGEAPAADGAGLGATHAR